jgi:hypothetical protein
MTSRRNSRPKAITSNSPSYDRRIVQQHGSSNLPINFGEKQSSSAIQRLLNVAAYDANEQLPVRSRRLMRNQSFPVRAHLPNEYWQPWSQL